MIPFSINAGRRILFCAAFMHSVAAFGQKYKLVWSDDFDGSGSLDSAMWTYDLGDGCPNDCGWGAGELQTFTSSEENVRVESGYLVIAANKSDNFYKSARVVTRGKADWQYGKIEVRARLPEAKGSRPLISMLPFFDDRMSIWPEDGQIDIMEHTGSSADVVHGMAHSLAYNIADGTERKGYIELSAVDKRFHTFSIEWTPTKIEWFVDGKKYHKMVDDGSGNEGWPFNNRFYLSMGISVGGSWHNSGWANSQWPQKMEIDFVRVYQKKQKKRRQGEQDIETDESY